MVLLVINCQVSDEEKSFKRASTNRSVNKNTRPSLCPRSICNVPHSSLSPPERCSITPLSLIFLACSPGQLPSITQMCHPGSPSARLLPPATNLSAKHTERQRSKTTSLQQEVHIWHSLRALSWYWTPPDMGRAAVHLTVLTQEWLNQVPNPKILFYAMTTQTSCHCPHSNIPVQNHKQIPQ